ncbi:hypothetical protein MM236_00645 [Belliella sp. DSM 107340]|uniref:Uncharacterized protein n=1 Tax=Belliella calami TaxID=2923436 RepID=A0ABS9UIM1_9BACT|nr:hypothetical protein [Belliella calami]MCH7396467.1 hypothetical protein [Belliella calami]
MKKKMDFKLIEGAFSSSEAKEIMDQLFNDKINFHVRKSFNSSIKYGIKDLHSEERIRTLKREIKKTSEFLDQEEVKGRTFLINANIELQSAKGSESDKLI